jgi:hypothetical protein
MNCTNCSIDECALEKAHSIAFRFHHQATEVIMAERRDLAKP